MAKLVWAFDFLAPIDPKTNKEVPLSQIDSEVATAYTGGVSSGPKPYDCRVVPRSAKHVEVLNRECQGAFEIFDKYNNE
jgi:hypothetical protein